MSKPQQDTPYKGQLKRTWYEKGYSEGYQRGLQEALEIIGGDEIDTISSGIGDFVMEDITIRNKFRAELRKKLSEKVIE